MIDIIFKSNQYRLLKRAIDVYQKQHESISKNVANANSQGYRRVNTDFSHELEVAKASRMKSSKSRHISLGAPQKLSVPVNNENVNNVDLTEEMAHLAENQIKYEFVTRMLNGLYRGISKSITGRTQ